MPKNVLIVKLDSGYIMESKVSLKFIL